MSFISFAGSLLWFCHQLPEPKKVSKGRKWSVDNDEDLFAAELFPTACSWWFYSASFWMPQRQKGTFAMAKQLLSGKVFIHNLSSKAPSQFVGLGLSWSTG